MPKQLVVPSGINFDVVSSKDATIVKLRLYIDNEMREFTGTSKRCNGDKYNAEIGTKIALGRALEAASKRMLKQGNGLVQCADDNAEASRKSKLLRTHVNNGSQPVAFRVRTSV